MVIEVDRDTVGFGETQAMADLNKVFLMGRLTFDPELRYTPSGSAVTELRLAINRFWTGRDGERKEETLFIDVTVWERQAENCCQYLKKGSQVHIEGALKMDTWDDKTTGEKRSKIKIQAERVQFLDRRGDAGGAPSEQEFGGSSRDAPASPRRAPERESRGPSPSNGPSRGFAPPGGGGGGGGGGAPSRRPSAEPEPDEDDIPF